MRTTHARALPKPIGQVRKQHLQRLGYEADVARKRHMQVDPENMLAADTLEADWNKKLKAVKTSCEHYNR